MAIPPELTDSIIDQLSGNGEALSACALTCRDWLPRTRYHRFRTVILTPENTSGFTAIVASHPGIAELACNLTVFGKPGGGRVTPSLSFPGMTNLRKLCVVRVDLSEPTTRAFLDSLLPRSIEQLELRGCWGTETSTLHQFLAALPSLKVLSTNVLWTDPLMERGVQYHDLPKLESFRCKDHSVGLRTATAHWFLSHQEACKNLSDLEFTVVHPRDGDMFGELIRRVGHQLRDLNLGLEPFCLRDSSDVSPLGLSSCTSLRKLTLQIKLRFSGFDGDENRMDTPTSHLSWLPQVFSQIRTPSLERVKLVVRAGGAKFPDLEAVDWTGLGQALASPSFAGVSKVDVHVVHGSDMKDKAIQFLKERMSELDAKGVLRVTHTYV